MKSPMLYRFTIPMHYQTAGLLPNSPTIAPTNSSVYIIAASPVIIASCLRVLENELHPKFILRMRSLPALTNYVSIESRVVQSVELVEKKMLNTHAHW